MSEHEVVCFQCGQPLGDPPRLNVDGDGEPCKACGERLLENLPGIFHTPFEPVGDPSRAAEADQAWSEPGFEGELEV